MSQVYSTEPSTSGHVTLQTTHGPIDIHLWCKECPHTCRLFLQLALDGYYENLPFHRIMEDFMIQTGQRPSSIIPPPSTSKKVKDKAISKQQSTVDDPKKINSYFQHLFSPSGGNIKRNPVETMARIRFNHRGQIAMARSSTTNNDTNEHEENDHDTEASLNGQFFLTLDATTHLNDQHVIFGTVVGPTMFNALRIGRVEAAEDGSPMDLDSCPRVKKVVIHHHSFSDLVMSKHIPWMENKETMDSNKLKKKKKRKGKRDLNVLSFGNEEEEMDRILDSENVKGIQSSHDVIGNENGSSFLSQKVDEQVAKLVYGDQTKSSTTDLKQDRNREQKIESESKSDNNITKSQSKSQSKISSKSTNESKSPSLQSKEKDIDPKIVQIKKPIPTTSSTQTSMLTTPQETNITEESDEIILNTTNTITTETLSKEPKKMKMSALEARRAKYIRKRKNPDSNENSVPLSKSNKNEKRNEDTMAKLLAFRSKVVQVKGDTGGNKQNTNKSESYHGQILDNDSNDDESDKNDWMKTTFKCKKHVDDESMRQEKNMGRSLDDYVVIDEKNSQRARSQANADRDSRGRRRNGDHSRGAGRRGGGGWEGVRHGEHHRNSSNRGRGGDGGRVYGNINGNGRDSHSSHRHQGRERHTRTLYHERDQLKGSHRNR